MAPDPTIGEVGLSSRDSPATNAGIAESKFFGEHATFHHVGLAVRSIRQANVACDVVTNRTEGVSMGFMRLHGITLELLEPLGERSPIARNLQSGVKLLHLCFEVPDLEAALESGRAAGFHRVSEVVRVVEFENRRIAWVFNRHFGLVELMESRTPGPMEPRDDVGSG